MYRDTNDVGVHRCVIWNAATPQGRLRGCDNILDVARDLYLEKKWIENNNHIYSLFLYQLNANATFIYLKNINSIWAIIFIQHIREMGITAFKAALKCQPWWTQ